MRLSRHTAGLTLALALCSTPAFAQEPETPQTEQLDELIEKEVVVSRNDGSEIPGTLLGVTDQSLTVVKADGRIVSIRRTDVESVSLATTQSAAAPAPAPTVAPPTPEPTNEATPVEFGPDRRAADERILVGAAYTGQYFDLFDTAGGANTVEGAFFGGRAYRYFLFVDQDGRRLSQANGWNLMGDADAYRRLSGRNVLLPMQIGSTVIGIAGLLTAIVPRYQALSVPLIVGGLGLGVTAGALRPIFERKRGILALEKAQEIYRDKH